MKNNKGLSVIELAIVVLLIGVAISLVAGSISTIFSLDVRSCTDQLDALIAKCRVNSVARAGEVYIKVYKNSANVVAEYYENGALVSKENIGKARVSIYYTDSDDHDHPITDAEPLYLSFDRTTGGLLDIGSSNRLADPDADANPAFCKRITVMNAVRTLNVTLVPSTGKHYVSA